MAQEQKRTAAKKQTSRKITAGMEGFISVAIAVTKSPQAAVIAGVSEATVGIVAPCNSASGRILKLTLRG